MNSDAVGWYDNGLLLWGEQEVVVGVDDREGGSRPEFWNMKWSTKLVLLHVLRPCGGEKAERFVCDLDLLAAAAGTGGGRREGWAGMAKGGRDSLLKP